MRRRTRLGLAALIVALALSGAYAAVWFVLARKVEDGFVAWARAAPSNHLEISWRGIGVGGFPLALRVELSHPRLADRALDPPLLLTAPVLWAAASPWDFRDWRLGADGGLTAEWAGSGQRLPVHFTAATATAAVAAGAAGGARLWLTLHDAAAAAGERVRARLADLWLILPDTPPRGDSDPLVAAALDLQAVEMPEAVRQFGDTIDRVTFALTAKGPFPDGPLQQAATAWRDAGGTVDLDKLRVEWGMLDASASGTFALDQDLQPECALSGAVEGFDQLIEALVRSGMMPARNAGLARLALTILAKTGPDGRPRIATSFTIQNGQMRLGPAKLGPAPHIDWN
jgi:hypothetical protein